MADDDRRSDSFIREVDEELRREQLKSLWDRFGTLFIGVCVLIVAITAGYRGWLWWEERRASVAGDRFIAAIEAIDAGNREEGETELAAIAEEGGAGYAALARMRLAGEQVAAGEKEDALAAYDALANDGTLPGPLRDIAQIRAALLALDLGDAAGAAERAEPLNQPGNPWRHASREVLGTAAYETRDLEAAREYFASIQQDAETPVDIWQRSVMMMSLIEGQLGPSGDDAGEQGAAEASEASPEAGAGNGIEQ